MLQQTPALVSVPACLEQGHNLQFGHLFVCDPLADLSHHGGPDLGPPNGCNCDLIAFGVFKQNVEQLHGSTSLPPALVSYALHLPTMPCEMPLVCRIVGLAACKPCYSSAPHNLLFETYMYVSMQASITGTAKRFICVCNCSYI
jgi:hypothetical protein